MAESTLSDQGPILPRGVTVAQVTLDHFVMVRIHARQPFDGQDVTTKLRKGA